MNFILQPPNQACTVLPVASLSGHRTPFLTLTSSPAYKLLMVLASTVSLRFGSRWDPRSHCCSVHALGPSVWREEGTWLLLVTLRYCGVTAATLTHSQSVCWSVKFLLGFVSTVSQLESPWDPRPRILFSPRYTSVAKWCLCSHDGEACLLRRRYVCCAAVSAQIYPRPLHSSRSALCAHFVIALY